MGRKSFLIIILLGIILSSSTYRKEYMSIAEMKVGLAENPLGLDTSVPRFGWQLVGNPHERGIYQTAYQLEPEFGISLE